MNKKSIVIITGIIALASAGCFSSSQESRPVLPPSSTPATPPISPIPSAGSPETIYTLKQMFIAEYPQYAKTLTVRVSSETQDHARGGISFVPGAPGGNFLATRIDGQWQIVFEGNGQISCDLSQYGFPESMLSDCSE